MFYLEYKSNKFETCSWLHNEEMSTSLIDFSATLTDKSDKLNEAWSCVRQAFRSTSRLAHYAAFDDWHLNQAMDFGNMPLVQVISRPMFQGLSASTLAAKIAECHRARTGLELQHQETLDFMLGHLSKIFYSYRCPEIVALSREFRICSPRGQAIVREFTNLSSGDLQRLVKAADERERLSESHE